jgi:hypothetical protein
MAELAEGLSSAGFPGPRAIGWNGGGGCVILSQDRHVNFSRAVSIIAPIYFRLGELSCFRKTAAPDAYDLGPRFARKQLSLMH